MRLGMAGGLTLLGMEYPVGVGNSVSKVTLELGTGGVV